MTIVLPEKTVPYIVTVFIQENGKKRFIDVAGTFPNIYEAEGWVSEQKQKKGGYLFQVNPVKDPSWVSDRLVDTLAA